MDELAHSNAPGKVEQDLAGSFQRANLIALRERVMVGLTTGWRPPSMHPCWCSRCWIRAASSAAMRACGWKSANNVALGAADHPDRAAGGEGTSIKLIDIN